jgi:hypothetical protein
MKITKQSVVYALAFGLLVSPFGVAAQTPGSPNRPGNAGTVVDYKIERKDVIRKADLETEVKATGKIQVRDPKMMASTTVKRIEALKDNQAKMRLTIDARKKEIDLRIKAQLATSTASSTKKLDVQAKARVRQQIENIYKRLTNHINKIVEIDGKVAARINVIAEAGVNVGEIEVQFKKAQAALDKAKADVEATKALAADKTATTTPSVSKDALKTLVKTAEDSIKAALKEYRLTIDLMKVHIKASINASEMGALKSRKTGSSTPDTGTTTPPTATSTATTTTQ